MNKINSGLMVLFVIFFFGAQSWAQNCTPVFKLDTLSSCDYRLKVSLDGACAPVKADLFVDGTLTALLGGELLFGTATLPLKAGNHVFSWHIQSQNGSVTDGSKTVYFPGSNKFWEVDCNSATVTPYHPNGDICKVGFKITRPVQTSLCAPVTETKVTVKNAQNSFVYFFTGTQQEKFTGSIPAGVYNVTFRTTFQTNNSPSQPFAYVDCPTVPYELPSIGKMLPTCDNATLSVDNCKWKISVNTDQPFANCTFVSQANVSITGPGVNYFQANAPSTLTYPGIFDDDLQANQNYVVTTTYIASNGSQKICTQILHTEKSPIQVDCSTAEVGFIPGPSNCTLGMTFKAPSFTCSAYEWQAVKVLNQNGTMVWMQMSSDPNATSFTWAGPVPPGKYTVHFITSTWELYEVYCDVIVYVPEIDPCCADHTPPTIMCNPLPSLSTICGQSIIANVLGMTAWDNCATLVQLSWFTTVKLGTQIIYAGPTNGATNILLNPGVYSVTYLVTDTNGNSSTCTQSLTVNSTTEPMVLNCFLPTVLPVDECNSELLVLFPIVSGGCGANPTKWKIEIFLGVNLVWNSDLVNVSSNIHTGVLPAGNYTVKVTVQNANGQSASCTSPLVVILPVVPWTTVDCAQVITNIECDGTVHLCAPEITDHCTNTTSFIACWTPALYAPGLLWQQCINGTDCTVIPFGTITSPGSYPLEVNVTLLNGQQLSCLTMVNVLNLDLCCKDSVPPTMHGCICLPDSLESCDPVSVFYDMEHLGYVDNCDNQNELELTLQVFQSGVIAPIATVTNSDFQMNLAPGVYTFVMTATDLHGNVDTTIHNLVIDCGGGVVLQKGIALTLAPNPTSDVVTIAFGDNVTAQVSVNTASGELVSTTQITGTGTLDLSDMSSGVYYVTARSEESTSTKLVVLIK